eukprot:160240-Amphidinium_carterae.1
MPRGKRKRQDVEQLGPLDASDLHKWPLELLERLPDASKTSLRSNVCTRQIVVSSSYSGIGSAELGAQMVFQALKAELDVEAHVTHYSACEKNPACVEVLRACAKPPEHIFTDLEGYVSEHDISMLVKMQELAAEDCVSLTEVGEALRTQKVLIGERFVDAALLYLRASVGSADSAQDTQTAWCAMHQKCCPVIPTQVLAARANESVDWSWYTYPQSPYQ